MGVIIYPSGIGTKVRSMNQNLQRPPGRATGILGETAEPGTKS